MNIETTSDHFINMIYDAYLYWVSGEKVNQDDVIDEERFKKSGIGHYIANIMIAAGAAEVEKDGWIN